MGTAEFFKFAGILNAELSQHHLLGFEIAQLLWVIMQSKFFVRLFLTWIIFIDCYNTALLHLYCYNTASVLCFGFLGMGDLNALMPDRACTPCTGRQSLNPWTTREVRMQSELDN